MIRSWPAVVFFLLAATAGAQTVVESIVFIPPRYYVGDRVEARLSLSSAAELSLSEFTAQPAWGIVHETRLERRGGGWDLRIVFTPFVAGTQTISRLRLGDVTLPDINVHVTSLIEEGHGSVSAPRGQLLLPATRLIFGLAAGFAMAVPFVVFFGLRHGRRYLETIQERCRRSRPRRQLVKALKALAARVEIEDSRVFYIQMLAHLRTYLSHRLHVPLTAATTRELLPLLRRRLPDPRAYELLAELFEFGDRVKFAGLGSGVDRRRRDLDALLSLDNYFSREAPHDL